MKHWMHEQRICATLWLYLTAYTVQRWAGDVHKALIGRRSASQVARMERKRGLS